MSQDKQPWQQRLEELEEEVSQTLETTPIRLNDSQKSLEQLFSRLQLWYQGLTPPLKVVVAVVAILGAFSLLNTVLKLVASLVALAILALILYGVYKFVLSPNSSEES